MSLHRRPALRKRYLLEQAIYFLHHVPEPWVIYILTIFCVADWLQSRKSWLEWTKLKTKCPGLVREKEHCVQGKVTSPGILVRHVNMHFLYIYVASDQPFPCLLH